ncbi:MAG: hypothetical protein HUU20_06460 [Pirellulales bacterium]|nr:hypothetical protein [Deltaproteobacteria bacterium]NUQ62110.1 hypothetical protein [Pirellulales bacterium]
MASELVAWKAHHAFAEPTVGVSVDVTLSGEVEVEGVWPDAREWLQNGIGATALQSFQALGLTPRDAANRLDALSADLLTRLNAAIGSYNMKAIRVARLEVHVSDEGNRALSDIQSALTKAKEETQRRRSLPG